MSITFHTDAPTAANDSVIAACMCAQDGPTFDAVVAAELEQRAPVAADVEQLAAAAWAACPYCDGQGYRLERSHTRELTLANANARILLDVLGVPFDYAGELSIADARRAIMRARARSNLERVERAPEQLGPRAFSGGYSAATIADRIARLSELVEQGAAVGATVLRWG